MFYIHEIGIAIHVSVCRLCLDRVGKYANLIDFNFYPIARLQCEIVRRYDTRSGQQHRPIKKFIIPLQEGNKLIQLPLELPNARIAFRHELALR